MPLLKLRNILGRFWVLVFLWIKVYGQPTHPLYRSFSFGEENQFPQQFSIASDLLGGIWMAGEEGLLYYNGHKFTTIPLPFRAVFVKTDAKGRIFAGCNSDFGTITLSKQKRLEYLSLGEFFTGKQEVSGEISNIVVIGDTVYAYTKSALYAISTDKKAKNRWSFEIETSGSAQFDKSILINHPQKGLCRVAGKKLEPLTNAALTAQKEIATSLNINDYWTLIATNSGNLFVANNQTVKPINEIWKQHNEAINYLQKFGVVDISPLGKNRLVIGTQTGGILYVNRFTGELLQIFNQQNGFLNNNIFAVATDPENGIWVALENGLVRIMENNFLSDVRQIQGTRKNTIEILDIVRHQNNLYVATRDGLFVLAQQTTMINMPVANFQKTNEEAQKGKEKTDTKNKKKKTKDKNKHTKQGDTTKLSKGDFLQIKVKTNVWEFERISGINNSCNKLLSLPEGLFVACDEGLYRISGKTASIVVPKLKGKYIGNIYPFYWPNGLQLIIATGSGLDIVTFQNNTFSYLGEIQEVNEKITTLAKDKNGTIWATPEDKGIYALKFSHLNDIQPKIKYYGKQHKLPTQPIKVISVGKQTIFYTDVRAYQKVEKKDLFVPDTALNQYITKQTSIHVGNNQDAWLLSDQQLFRIIWKESRIYVDTLTDLVSPIYFQTRAINDIFPDTFDNAWIATAKGLFLLRAKKQQVSSNFQVWLTELRSIRDTVLFSGFLVDKDGIAYISKPNLNLGTIPYDFNTLTFYFAASAHNNSLNTWYQHFLEGLEDDWSNWTHDPTAHYSKLPPGSYTLYVRARNLTGEMASTAHYQITVEAPFYLRWYAYLLYIFTGLGLIFGIIYLNNKRLQAENKRLDLIVKERTAEVEGKKVQLQQTNIQLEEQKNQLQEALEQVKSTQEQLVQSEKMAALGVMIASIAHEINSPFGAIKNTIHTLSEQIPELYKLLKVLVETTDTNITQQIFQLVDQINNSQSVTISTREERKLRNTFIEELKQAQIPNPENIAIRLVEMGLRETPAKYVSLLTHHNAESFLATAELLAKLSNSIKRIRMAAEKTQKIVGSLKSYSHQTTVVEEATPFDLAENIDTVLTIYQAELKQGIDVTRNIEPGITLLGWPDELTQVWTNLITNAIHGMKGKGELTISALKNPTHVVVQITDNGAGIEPEVIDKIFQPFFTTKPKGQGSGLGLHITKEIVQKHHGQVWAESKPQKTTFFVELPMYQKES